MWQLMLYIGSTRDFSTHVYQVVVKSKDLFLHFQGGMFLVEYLISQGCYQVKLKYLNALHI